MVRIKLQVDKSIECRSVPTDVDLSVLRNDLIKAYGERIIKYLDAEVHIFFVCSFILN